MMTPEPAASEVRELLSLLPPNRLPKDDEEDLISVVMDTMVGLSLAEISAVVSTLSVDVVVVVESLVDE